MNKEKKNIRKPLLIIFVILIMTIIIVAISLIILVDENTEPEYIEKIYNINDINYELLNMNNDFYQYYKEGYRAVIGLDLSEHNKEVDFNILKEQGIEFVILRLGWRGYYDPSIHIDKRFEEYYEKASETGLKIGVYFFSQAISVSEVRQEANFVIENLKDKTIDFYVAYDCESINSSIARTNALTMEQATINAKTFLYLVEEAGYTPMLYTNMDWIKNYYKPTLLKEYPIWYAQYSRKPQYRGNHIIWQYASGMNVEGVSGENGTDLNLMILKKEEAN